MKALVTVIGKDKVGIIARISSKLSEFNVNVEDISQTLLQNNFVMIMLVDVTNSTYSVGHLNTELEQLSKELNVSIRIQREDLFDAMHKI